MNLTEPSKRKANLPKSIRAQMQALENATTTELRSLINAMLLTRERDEVETELFHRISNTRNQGSHTRLASQVVSILLDHDELRSYTRKPGPWLSVLAAAEMAECATNLSPEQEWLLKHHSGSLSVGLQNYLRSADMSWISRHAHGIATIRWHMEMSEYRQGKSILGNLTGNRLKQAMIGLSILKCSYYLQTYQPQDLRDHGATTRMVEAVSQLSGKSMQEIRTILQRMTGNHDIGFNIDEPQRMVIRRTIEDLRQPAG